MSTTWDVETKDGNGGNQFETPPDGAIPARICALIDVGTHDARSLKGEVYQRRVLMMGFELGEADSKGDPFFMTKLYSLSLDLKSNLYAVVKAIHGELKVGDKFSPDMLAAKPCLLQISHQHKEKRGKVRTYANLDSVGKPPRGSVTPPGGCVVWRIADRAAVALPDVSFLPPVWHEDTGKMLTIPEWVDHAYEVTGAARPASQAADSRLAAGVSEPARDVRTTSPTPSPAAARRPAMAVAAVEEGEVIPF